MPSTSRENELIYLNALNNIPCLGPKRINTLLERYSSSERAWQSSAEELAAFLQVDDLAIKLQAEMAAVDAREKWEQLLKDEVRVLSRACPGYPKLLNELACPPPIIYYRGSLEKINLPAVAIVGSRRCTFYGREVAGSLAAELSTAGVGVISGMALGIDTAAHRGAIESDGFTVAVLGCGIDTCYPPQNRSLMKEIESVGAVLGEFPLGVKPLANHFPRRNRIISGLSLGTVVVEATAKSGSLITASYALEQNREVFAVPGNVGSPYSRGSHRLIKEGARLVESAADILDELRLSLFGEEQLTIETKPVAASDEEQKLLELIPFYPLHIDNIISLSGLKASEASFLLLGLELKKSIRQTPGKYFCRI